MAKIVRGVTAERLSATGDAAVGMKFPIEPFSPDLNYTTAKQIDANLRNLILTIKGERVMQPNFGSDVYFLLFEQLDEATLSAAAVEAIRDATERWMPYIDIVLVDVEMRESEHICNISINYRVAELNIENTLNLAVRI